MPTIKRYGIPVIGADLTNNTWFSNPLMFPQGSPPQAVAYGYVAGAVDYHKKNIGIVWCVEVPRSCEQINRAFLELAPKLGAVVKKSSQVSITTYPVAVGNQQQFFGNKWLGDAYVPQNVFAWMANSTAAEKYWQASVRKYNPGFDTGGAANLGWTAGALLVAASAGLSEQNPSTQQLLDTLYTFQGQEFTKLGGLSPSPLTYRQGGTPKVPYCLFAAVTNDANNGWKFGTSKPTCTELIAPSDPQNSG